MTQIELSVEILSRSRPICKRLIPIGRINIGRISRIYSRPSCCVGISICAHITSKNPRPLRRTECTTNLIYSCHVLDPSRLLTYSLNKGIILNIIGLRTIPTFRKLRIKIGNKNILITNTIKLRQEHIRKFAMTNVTLSKLIIINTRNKGCDSHNITGTICYNIESSRITITKRGRTLITKILISIANLSGGRSTNILEKNIRRSSTTERRHVIHDFWGDAKVSTNPILERTIGYNVVISSIPKFFSRNKLVYLERITDRRNRNGRNVFLKKLIIKNHTHTIRHITRLPKTTKRHRHRRKSRRRRFQLSK